MLITVECGMEFTVECGMRSQYLRAGRLEWWSKRRPADWKRCWSLEREPGCLSWWAGRWEGSIGLSSQHTDQNGLASTL